MQDEGFRDFWTRNIPSLVVHPTNRKWVITPDISGHCPHLSILVPFITRVVTHLLSGMNHQVASLHGGVQWFPSMGEPRKIILIFIKISLKETIQLWGYRPFLETPILKTFKDIGEYMYYKGKSQINISYIASLYSSLTIINHHSTSIPLNSLDYIYHFHQNFPERNHPAMGVPPWLWNPPFISIYRFIIL